MEKTWRKSRERLTKRPDLISRSLAGGFCIGHARMSIATAMHRDYHSLSARLCSGAVVAVVVAAVVAAV